MTRRRVTIAEAVALSPSRYLNDPGGLAAVLDAIDALAADPRPAGSVHRGDYHRLRAGRYRVLSEITGDLITATRVGRLREG